MSELTENQQNFVWALVQAGGDATRGALLAGFGGNDNSRSVAVHRLMHNPKVLAAIKEVAEQEIKGIAFVAAAALREIVSDPGHKDRLRAIDMTLNRAGLIVVQEHKVTHETKDPSIEAVVARIRALATDMQIDPRPLLLGAGVPQDVIDAEFEEVPSMSAKGLEDLL